MKKIFLTQNKFAIVDDDMFDHLNQWKWYFNQGYAVRAVTLRNGTKRQGKIFMHRIVNLTPDHLFTDHLNGNKLDNRKENLRVCTTAQNAMNSVKKRFNKSGYKGVSKASHSEKWMAAFRKNGKQVYLGLFETKQMAAKTYDKAVKKHFGEFAKLNLVSEK